MNDQLMTEHTETIVIGGGQAGLSVGYYLARRNIPFVILDDQPRVGDSWRNRWDSLRLFTPARYDGLAGMPFPASGNSFPSKDEMADFLEAYAARFELPIRSGVRVDGLSRRGDRFVVTAGEHRFEADHVIVAMSSYQVPRMPLFAERLDPSIMQLHSREYRNPSQFLPGDVLVVGAGNSGAEIALEASREHTTWLAGPDTGHVPVRIETFAGQFVARFVVGVLFHRLFTVDTPLGRKMRPNMITHGAPLIRTKPSDLARAGVQRVPRMTGVDGGHPVLEAGPKLDVTNVVWSTGFHPGFPWIDLPVFGDDGEPLHERGVVPSEPGLYFVGLHFLYAASSAMVQGVGRDAKYVVEHLAAHRPSAPDRAAAHVSGAG